MKMTKQQLKKIIKEELSGVLNEMGPDFPGEKFPQGDEEMDQALDVEAPPPAPRNAEEEMNQWFTANPNASADEIRDMWSNISFSYRTGR
jgi:hypothetical protein|tara:strand:+ start:1034 stop:1303 length:270 start_codon:yes stop_codon:yes gene_type:complete